MCRLLLLCIIILIIGACSPIQNNKPMKDTKNEAIENLEDRKEIIRISSSLPTPAPNTRLMFEFLDQVGEYQLPNGETVKGELAKIYSTDGDDIPEPIIGVGGEFELLGYRYKVIELIRSTNYKESSDIACVEVLGKVEGNEEEE